MATGDGERLFVFLSGAAPLPHCWRGCWDQKYLAFELSLWSGAAVGGRNVGERDIRVHMQWASA